MAINAENLSAKVDELTTSVQSIKTTEDAMAFAFQAFNAIRDAKELVTTEAAKVETKELLTFALPFIPTKYQFLAKSLLSVLGLFGGGWGFGELIDQPDEIAVTIPAETQAELDAQAAKMEAAIKAAEGHRESFEVTVKELQAAKEAMEAAANKKFVIRGYDKDNRTVTELDFFRNPPGN